MSWIIFWVVVGLYWVVAIKRIPVYYRRYDESDACNYESEKGIAWYAILTAMVWPYYEAGRWVQNYVIHSATAEERKQAEYEKAAKIVEDYTKKKDREDREAFDRELRGGA
jgi:hypothetical protein